MKLVYRLVGYDRDTEKLVEKHVVPAKLVVFAKRVARINPEDRNSIGDVPLNAEQARDIAGAIGADIHADRRDYFLEPYPEKAHTRHAAHA